MRVQYFRRCTQLDPSTRLDFYPCADWACERTMLSATGSPTSLASTQTLSFELALSLLGGRKPRTSAVLNLTSQLLALWEYMNIMKCQARDYDKRRPAVTFDPGDCFLVRPAS